MKDNTNIKILLHLMPWEIDYALLSFTQLKKSKYHIPDNVNITIDTVLNLSSYLIDWDKSKLPKEYFIDKYNQISNLLVDYKHDKKIYDGEQLYGHLDSQKSISTDIDYYLVLCPDVYFSEYLLPYITQLAQSVNNKYFMITPQIGKFWDNSWDSITNPIYLNKKNEEWSETDVFDIAYNNQYNQSDISLLPINNSKWAGWFDLYNKAFYEELCPVLDEWKGYGGWDLYSMIITSHVKKLGVDFQQYALHGETIFEYSVGPLYGKNRDGFSSYYKDLLVLKDNSANGQRQDFESNIQKYVSITLNNLKEKNII
jgi:hypothetical protein